MSTETNLTILVGMMVNAVLFGAGMIVVLSVPALAVQAIYLVPAVIVASFVISPFISRIIAPRMRARWVRRQSLKEGSAALVAGRQSGAAD